MKDFQSYLEESQEIGFVEQVVHALIYASGLPKVRPFEVVVFERGQVGQVISLSEDLAEILLLSTSAVKVGDKVCRTQTPLTVGVGEALLGASVDALCNPFSGRIPRGSLSPRPLVTTPLGIGYRKNVDRPFETGVTIVDLAVPLGKGQRELVIGDRKSGKTPFLQQVILTQARQGTICVYTAIAKRWFDTQNTIAFFKKNGVDKNIVTVVSGPAGAPGLVFLTPYTAITIAEYFRDQGKDVLVVLDDMTAHAKYYREITLSARRFPGRSAYPGDIFFVQSRILERAGNFIKGSITCLPVAETVFRDFSGYIQTNLMSMTDGHIFFDGEYFNQGRRPAINAFLSVTRVGLQAQSPIVRDINRELSRFMVYYDEMQQFMHFGSELSLETRRTLSLGDRIVACVDQGPEIIIPMNASAILFAALWAGFWREVEIPTMKFEMQNLVAKYIKDSDYRAKINSLIEHSKDLADLVSKLKNNEGLILEGSGGEKEYRKN